MKILIDTDGFAKNTKIEINGKQLTNDEVKEFVGFNFSVKSPGKVKLQYFFKDKNTNQPIPTSLWGADIQYYDRAGESKPMINS
ncbi:MAG: hypothetical protein V1709_00745 [Planctomycetota bacterium]